MQIFLLSFYVFYSSIYFLKFFFSFCRKIYQKKSPVFPDNEHLHMLSYFHIYEIFGPNKSNYMNSVLINSIYCFLVLPSIYFAENTLISKYWFFSLILVYTLCYFRLYRLTKNQIDI